MPRTIDARTWVTAVVRAGYGTALLLVPERILALGARPPFPPPAAAVARVLGARHVLQAVVTVAAHAGPVLGAGALVDAAHAGTDVALAAVSPRWRRIALADATVAALFAAGGWTGWRNGSR